MVLRRSQRHPAGKVSDLDFADDIVELEQSLEKAQSQVDLLVLTAKEVGLHINTTKTKLITCNIPHASLQLDGEDILKIFNILAHTLRRLEKTLSAGKGKHGMRFGNWIVFGGLLHHSNKRCNCLKRQL